MSRLAPLPPGSRHPGVRCGPYAAAMLPALTLRPVASGPGARFIRSAPGGAESSLTRVYVGSTGVAPPVRASMENWWDATLPLEAEA